MRQCKAFMTQFDFLLIALESNPENCLDLIFVESPVKINFVSVKTFITSAIRKFMLEMPSPGSFQSDRPFKPEPSSMGLTLTM